MPAAPDYAPRLRTASRALQLGIALQCAALGWLAFKHGTPVDALFFMELETSEASAIRIDRALAGIVLAAGALILLRPWPAAAVTVAIVFLVQAVAIRIVGGRAFSDMAPAAHATRWLAPLAIAVIWWGHAPEALSRKRVETATWVLRIAIAATFLVHGLQAVGFHPAFVDLLIGTARRWTDTVPSEASARVVLVAIGTLDVFVALGILCTRWPLVAAWATVWGLLTMVSRVVALGTDYTHESLIRVLNGLAPLALWALWKVLAAGQTTRE